MVKSREDRIFQFIAHFVMILVVICIVAPFVLLFMSSVTEENTLIRNGYSFFPEQFSLDAYRYIMNSSNKIFKAYGMTIVVTAIGTAANLLLSSLLAYGLSLKNLPFKRAISFYVFFTMLFNGGLVPTYIMYTSTFHIKNTLWALIIPSFMMSAMNVMLIRTFFTNSIPSALYEAAEIDGAGHVSIFKNVVLPLGKPILVTMGLFSALAYWNDWTNGMYYLSGTDGEALYTIQNLLNRMISKINFLSSSSVGSSLGSEFATVPATGVRMAIAFIAMIPLLIIYPFLQKYFQEGIALGAVKG